MSMTARSGAATLFNHIDTIDGVLQKLKTETEPKMVIQLKIWGRSLLKLLPAIPRASKLKDKKKALIEDLEQLKVMLSVGKIVEDVENGKINQDATIGELLTGVGVTEPKRLVQLFREIGVLNALAPQEISSKIPRQYEKLQIDLISKMDLSSTSEHSSLAETLRLQISATLQMKHLINEAAQRLKADLLAMPSHKNGLIHDPYFYKPYQTLLSLMNYIPLEVFNLIIFLDKQKDNFEAFLKAAVNIPAVVEETFQDLPAKKKSEIAKLITKIRALVISYSKNFYELARILDKHVVAGKISEADLNKLKKNIILLLLENTKAQITSQPQAPALSHLYDFESRMLLKSMENPGFIVGRSSEEIFVAVFQSMKVSLLKLAGKMAESTKEEKVADFQDHKKKKRKKSKKAKEVQKEKLEEEHKDARDSDVATAAAVKDKFDAPSTAVQSIAFFRPGSQEAEIKALTSLVDYIIPESKDDRVTQIALSIQANSILYSTMLLMEIRKKSPNAESAEEARYLRYALAHCKDVVDETALIPNQRPEELKTFHREVCEFGRLLLVHAQDPGKSQLKTSPLYSRLINRGKELAKEWDSFSKQEISADDRLSYTQWLGLQWAQYNSPEPLPVTPVMFEYACKMLLDKFVTYGSFHFKSDIVRKLLAEKHGQTPLTSAELSDLGRTVNKELAVRV